MLEMEVDGHGIPREVFYMKGLRLADADKWGGYCQKMAPKKYWEGVKIWADWLKTADINVPVTSELKKTLALIGTSMRTAKGFYDLLEGKCPSIPEKLGVNNRVASV